MNERPTDNATCQATRWARTWVEIDLGALARNLDRVAQRLPQGQRIVVSAKKEAYGHGLIAVACAIGQSDAVAAMGVATIEEGIALREAGYARPIICFSVLTGEALTEAIVRDLTLTVTNFDETQQADHTANALGKIAKAHLKLDTGMGRLGRFGEEIAGEIDRMRSLEHLRIEAACSHLADGWADRNWGQDQWERFETFRRASGLDELPCHWGGSDALGLPSGALGPSDWLRSGIALYGDHPAIEDLEPVMTFKSRVVYRRSVPEGTTISYGGTFRTARPTELAVVGAGYGNGVLRSLSGCGRVLIGGTPRSILGRVCMDQVVVDVTDGPETTVGDEAVFFGRQGAAILPACDVASVAGTISYELFCLAGNINPRIYR